MVMYCPYCDIEIDEKQLENEDGCCPECGAYINASMVITDSEDDEEEDEFAEFNDDLNYEDPDDEGGEFQP